MSRFEIKIVVALLLIAVIPTVASVVLVGQVIRVSEGVAEGQSRRLTEPLEQAADAYRQLFDSLKAKFQLRAALVAADPDLRHHVQGGEAKAAATRLAALRAGIEDAQLLRIRLPSGAQFAASERRRTAADHRYRDLNLVTPIGAGGHTLEAIFLADRQPFEDFARLGKVARSTRELTLLRGELATYYRVVFIIMFGSVLVLSTLIGLFIARRTARRVALLAAAGGGAVGGGPPGVGGAGDLETRVQVRARDELGDLAQAFNEMVTKLRTSQDRIAYLEKIGAWQQVARRLAHEIKNPLTPIQLAVQQLERKYPGGDEAFDVLLADACDIIREEVGGLRRLVVAFSGFAKLPEVQPEPLDVNSLIDDFLRSRSEMQERASVSWTPMEPAVTVRGDRMLIKHVLLNLVENAIQAAEEAGSLEALQVTVTATPDPGQAQLHLEVHDNGPGMAFEIADRAFEPYYTTKEHGTGLGLAIVKKIVLDHQGAIDVESEPGSGTRFTLHLPLPPPDPGKSKKKST